MKNHLEILSHRSYLWDLWIIVLLVAIFVHFWWFHHECFFGGRFPFGKASFLISWNIHLRIALFFYWLYQKKIVFLESNISKKQGNLSRYIHFIFQKVSSQNTPSQPPEMSEAKSDDLSALPFGNMIMNWSFRIFGKLPQKICMLFVLDSAKSFWIFSPAKKWLLYWGTVRRVCRLHCLICGRKV